LTDDIENIEAARARLRALRAAKLAERIEAGEVISVPLVIVAGSKTEAARQVDEEKASKLAELHAAGDQREVVFAVTVVKTGVVRHDEIADQQSEPWKPTAPPVGAAPRPDLIDDVVEEELKADPQPPIIATYFTVQTRRCDDDDDPGAVAEGYFSVDDNRRVIVTDVKGRYIGSRTMVAGEDARMAAKRLLREKTPEAESFNNRVLYYPNTGLA
jgi:hypothetical protein